MVQLEAVPQHVVQHAPELQPETMVAVEAVAHLVMVETAEANVVHPVHRIAEPRLRILIMAADHARHAVALVELPILEDHARQGVHHHAQLMELDHHVRVAVVRPDAKQIVQPNVRRLVETDVIHHVDQVVMWPVVAVVEDRVHHAILAVQVVAQETVERVLLTVAQIAHKVAQDHALISVIQHAKINAVKDAQLHAQILAEEIARRNVLEAVLNLVKVIVKVIVVQDATQTVVNHAPQHVLEVAHKTVLVTARQNALMDAVITANPDAHRIVRVTAKDAPRHALVSARHAEEIVNQHVQDVLVIAGVPAKVVVEPDVHPDVAINVSTDVNQIAQAVLPNVVDAEKDAIRDVMQTAQNNVRMDVNHHALTDVHINVFQVAKVIVSRPAMTGVIRTVMSDVIQDAEALVKRVATILVHHRV